MLLKVELYLQQLQATLLECVTMSSIAKAFVIINIVVSLVCEVFITSGTHILVYPLVVDLR